MQEPTGQKWCKEYEQWKASKKTQRVYCAEHGYSFSEFKVQTSKARKTEVECEGLFAPVQVSGRQEEALDAPYCEIIFSGKTGIRIETKESIFELKTLIDSLK